MKRLFLTGLLLSTPPLFPSLPFTHPRFMNISSRHLDHIDSLIKNAITQEHIPGAVILAAHQEKIFYRQAFGNRAPSSAPERMTIDTLFDLASLTKIIATAPSVLLLAERGYFYLNAPVCKYLPDFAQNGKTTITIRQLLTHRPGIAPTSMDLDLAGVYTLPFTSMSSDHCYMVLGELVRVVSGSSLDAFAHTNIFSKLDMHDTMFLPPDSISNRIAPTMHHDGVWIGGTVLDFNAQRMGGVAGHAGLFSTAHDLVIFCQMILNNGTYKEVKVLSPTTINLIKSWLKTPEGSHLSTFRGDFFSPEAIGLTGYTGTSLVLDPQSQTILIILSNTTGSVVERQNINTLRAHIANIVASAVGKV